MTNYLSITDHIYFNGYSFRVRFIKDGVKNSKYFKNRKDAIKFKKLQTK